MPLLPILISSSPVLSMCFMRPIGSGFFAREPEIEALVSAPVASPTEHAEDFLVFWSFATGTPFALLRLSRG